MFLKFRTEFHKVVFCPLQQRTKFRTVINGGFMTNYVKISRGVRQGCPLNPFLFILAVEILALKICQNLNCKGIPNNKEVTISQFADNTIYYIILLGTSRV